MKKIFRVLKTTFLLFIGLLSAAGGSYVYGVIRPPVEYRNVEVTVPVVPPKKSVRELVEEMSPEFHVSPLLVGAIVERESGGKMDAVRFEPSQVERARKVSKSSNENQVRAYASSHCALQVMGYHAPKYGVSWADLYTPETCFRVGLSILKDCMDRNANKPKVQQIHGALACYNGSTEYADAVIGRLGELLIEQSL